MNERSPVCAPEAVECREHQHDHHSHSHVHEKSSKRLIVVMGLTFLFMIIEATGGVWIGSLALLSDATHMFSDLASLGIALAALQLAARKATWHKTYGYRRAEVLAAFVNGLAVFGLASMILLEAIGRFKNPLPILQSGPMIAIAGGGLLVNFLGILILHPMKGENLNMRGAYLHVVGDLLGSVGALTSAVIIHFTGWFAADAVVSILIAVLIFFGAARLLWDTSHILMQGSPPNLNLNEIMNSLEKIPNVEEVEHLHVWLLSSGLSVATVHLRIGSETYLMSVLKEAKKVLAQRWEIHHPTIQVEVTRSPSAFDASRGFSTKS